MKSWLPTKVPGKLIAMEGLDGSGKSTQIHLLLRWLQLDGYKVFFTQWNSSPLVSNATKKGKKKQIFTPTTFSLIHATDFADRYERQILPLLHAGYIVLADRYIFTAFARDAVRGCNREWLRKLYSFARHPDITFFMDVPPETALNRLMQGRPKLKYYESGMDLGFSDDPEESFSIFQGKIYEEYLKIADEYNFIRIPQDGSPSDQHQEIRRIVQEKIDLPRYRWKILTT
jgi:dTMP kinase